GDGQGRFQEAAGSLSTEYRGWKVHLKDLDQDGRTDLVTSGMGSSVMVWRGNGRGVFSPVPGSPFPVGSEPWGLAVADVNGDGKLDVV
ncbi:VCBS repeat-containing protein, partial [Acidobacteriia bacterium AH_259_A11_L15]|nr:VCBS repeat-containing protein [Acidobacteriia bacterium AH_259_A11_L15]